MTVIEKRLEHHKGKKFVLPLGMKWPRRPPESGPKTGHKPAKYQTTCPVCKTNGVKLHPAMRVGEFYTGLPKRWLTCMNMHTFRTDGWQ